MVIIKFNVLENFVWQLWAVHIKANIYNINYNYEVLIIVLILWKKVSRHHIYNHNQEERDQNDF